LKATLRERNKVMRIVTNFHAAKRPNAYISAEYLYHHGLSRKSNAEYIVSILVSMKLLKYDNPSGDRGFIMLTDNGKHYFEQKSDDLRKFIRRSIYVPIFVAIITTILTLVTVNLLAELLPAWLSRLLQ